jgi:hypothetical protein
LDELPPRPDPVTGLPEPPRAPGIPEDAPPPEKNSGRERDPLLAPKPPRGQGPLLFWFRLRRGYTLGLATCCGVFTMLLAGIGYAWDVILAPLSGVMFLAMVGVYYLIGRSERYRVGADWAAGGRRWVRTYELVNVTASSGANDDDDGIFLTLKDAGGRKMYYRVEKVVEADHRIWNYTYNGILHSVIASGAETNEHLHRRLGVPYPYPTTPDAE